MTTPKPCPACNAAPHIYYNDIVWRCECRNRDCPSVEATTGISGIARHNVINNWNNVICPSVINQLREEYYEATRN